MHYRAFYILGWLLIATNIFGQRTDVKIGPSEILKLIGEAQSYNDSSFPNGGFVTYRKSNWSRQLKVDNNSFYTALILFNLNQYADRMSKEDQQMLKRINEKAIPYFNLFKNNNKPSYNFWPKYPPVIFPNGGWLNNFNESGALPDDIDDGSMIQLALKSISNDSLAIATKNQFTHFVNTKNKTTKGFYSKYKNQKVYSTWLGNKMPVDIDMSVLCNTLLLSEVYQLPLNQIDSNTYNLLIQLVKEGKHLNDPAYVSPHYEKTATILYHLSRLYKNSHYAPFKQIKSQLVNDAQFLLTSAHYPLEKLLLQNALLNLGEKGAYLLADNPLMLQQNDYSLFIANLATLLPNPFKRWMTKTKFLRYSYYCYPYNLSVWLENYYLNQP